MITTDIPARLVRDDTARIYYCIFSDSPITGSELSEVFYHLRSGKMPTYPISDTLKNGGRLQASGNLPRTRLAEVGKAFQSGRRFH